MAKLKIKDEHGKERVHELIDDVTTVGRASANTIQVSDDKASRQHFKIERTDKRFKVSDMGSTNGTKVNGKKIKEEVLLKPGDEVLLGKTSFVYDDEELKKNLEAEEQASIVGGETVEMEPVKKSEVPKASAAAAAAVADPEQAKGPKFVLKVIEGKNPGHHYPLGTEALTMGRHSSNTIQIVDDATSNYHAEIKREPIGYVLTDLGSTNGTRVKLRNKNEFEKVVKTPLAVGMQIRVGKTLLEYENVGEPVEDDSLFGTVALDPQKFEEVLTERPRSSPFKPLLMGAAFVAVVLVVVALGRTENPNNKPLDPVKPPADLSNRIQNGDFAQGTDDAGNPKFFRIERGAPGIQVAVITEGEADPAKPGAQQRMWLQVGKASAKVPVNPTVVETSESFAVDPGKAYEFSGRMKNDGDGLFGLCIEWSSGERTFIDPAVVLKDTQEWKDKSMVLTPPAWATRAKAGVFVIGKEGKACFDSLVFREKANTPATAAPVIRYGGITIAFEGTKGAFTATCQGEHVIDGGTLMLVSPQGGAISDLSKAFEAQLSQDSAKAEYDGRLYDFALQELTNYQIKAQQGATGVDLRAAVDSINDSASPSLLRFHIVGPVANGPVEVMKSSDNSETVAASENVKTSGVQELLFNPGNSLQLDISFASPADVEIRREGQRRKVTIHFRSEVKLSLATESLAQKNRVQSAILAMQKCVDEKRWGEAEAKVKEMRGGLAARFGNAKEAADKAAIQIDEAWREAKDEMKRAVDTVQQVKTNTAADQAKEIVNRHKAAWLNSGRDETFADNLKQIETLRAAGSDEHLEELAEQEIAKAKKLMMPGTYHVAVSLLKTKILDDARMSRTKAADTARQLAQEAQDLYRQEEAINVTTGKLKEKTASHISAGNYKAAIDLIEADSEYKANKDKLTAINKLLDDWKKKLK